MLKTDTRCFEHCGKELLCTLTETCIDDYEQMRYTAFGVRVTDENNNVVFKQSDISTDRAYVEEFIGLCDTYEVSLVHISDILDDYLD